MYNSYWYNSLIQPPLTPPDWLFLPVWTVLYITIILSINIFATKKSQNNKITGYMFFIFQAILNLAWQPIFFIYENIRLALLVIILMDIFVLLTIRNFIRISKIAGKILIPYLTWILFATYLNAGYLILNPR